MTNEINNNEYGRRETDNTLRHFGKSLLRDFIEWWPVYLVPPPLLVFLVLPIYFYCSDSDRRKTQEENYIRQNLVGEYDLAANSGKERHLGTFNVYSELTNDVRNCSFFGVDLDGDGRDDIRRQSVSLRGGMTQNEYFDLREGAK